MKGNKAVLMKFLSTQAQKLAGEDNVFVDKSSIEGQGLFANKGFKKGEIIGLAHQQGQPVGLTGNFHNHSSSPNAVSVKQGSNRFLVAAKNLPAGAEITSDYRMQPELEQPSANWMQRGGLTLQPYYTPAAESTGVNYTPTMTVQAAEKLKAQRDAQELARRKQAIQASQAAASKPLKERYTPENLAQETGAIGDKLRFFPNDPDSFIDEYLNPLKMIGDMASGLGRIPLNLKQGNYGTAALDVAIPVATGALAGLGAKTAGQFVNNLANPLAGTGQFLTTKTPLRNAYKYNPWAFKPNSEAYYRVIGKEGLNDALESGVIRANPKNIHPFSGEPIYDRPYFSKGVPFDRDWKSPFKNKKGKQVVGSIYPDETMVEVLGHNKFHKTGDLVTSPIGVLNSFDKGINFYKRDWLRGYKEVPKPKQLPGAGDLAANAAAKSSTFGQLKSGLQDLGYIYDQSLGYLFNNRANKKAIAEGNEWLRNWIQHPATQAKIDNDFADKINRSFVKDVYDLGYEQAKNFTPVSTELPLSVQLVKGFYPNKGNWGVSYLHRVDPMPRRMIEQGQMDAPIWHGSFISRTLDLPYKQRVGTTIHEGTHDWTSRFALETSGQREFLERNINPEILQDLHYWKTHGDKKTIADLGKARRYQAYLANPTEQHARIMELRKYLGHTPDFVSTPEYAQEVMDDLRFMPKKKRPIDSEGFFKVIDNDPQKLSNMFNRLWGVAPVAVAGAAAASEKQNAQPTMQEYENGGPTPTYFAGTLPEVMVSSDGTSYPYYNKLTAEEKKYFNQNSSIGRAVRSIASTGKRGQTANDLGEIARGVEEFAAEMTGIPGSIRFSQDPVKKLKGLGRTVEATILGSSPFITSPYNQEDVADAFDALDALGFATTAAGLVKTPLQKAANLTGRYLTQGPLKNAYRLNPVAAKQPTEVILSRVQRPGQTADLSRLDELLQKSPESLTLAEKIELARINQPGYGRGFSSNPNDISYYSSPGIQSSRGYVGMPEIRSIRLPAEKAARFNIRQNPVEGYFSGAPGREYLLPRNYVELSKKLTPQTFEELEQIRRLTDAETTVLNTPHWWRGYPRINTPKQLFTSHSADFSKYLTQKEAVAARAERLLSQKHKKGWNEQLTPELEEKLSTAVQRHNPAGDYPGTSLGTNRSGRTETLVSKDANIKGVPLTDAQKSMIAAHETGHYYSNSLKEGMDWEKYFNFSDLPYRTSKYLKGKRHNFGNEIRERAAQLKDYIAFKNNIPLNQDFKITRTQLDDALENYVKETGLDNTMTPFIEALKKKGNISGFLKEMNKRPLVLLPPTIGAGTYGVNQKQEGGQHGGLDRWFAEKWVDIKTGKECGRQEGEKRAGYPACRPSKRISEDTPKTASELSSSEKEKFKRSKTSSERISYQHKRKQDGGEWLDKYENTKENRQKVDQLFGLPAAGNVNYVPLVESLVGGFSAGLAKNALVPVVKSSLRSLQKYMEMQENPFVKIDLPVFNEAKNWLNNYTD